MRTKKNTRGLTLIEVMLAILILGIAVIGAMAYRYYSSLDARIADQQITAGRIGLLLLEGWGGMGGRGPTDPDNNFKPPDFSVPAAKVVVAAGSGPVTPSGFASFGSFTAISEGGKYYATLSYQDVDRNGDGILDVRILNVTVSYPRSYTKGNY